MNKSILLLGFRGSGKTTIGKKLAKILGYGFLETDLEIESSFGKPISEIIQGKSDWEIFRKKELQIVTDILENRIDTPKVISCGGGVGVNEINGAEEKKILDKFKSKTFQVVLLLPKEIIAARLKKDYLSLGLMSRPGFKKINYEAGLNSTHLRELEDLIQENLKIYSSRIKYYSRIGTHQLKINKQSPEEICEMILRNLKIN